MVLVIHEGRCPKCGSQGLYITQEEWKPVTIKCRRIHSCGWEADILQFWPKKEDFKEQIRKRAEQSKGLRQQI